MQLCLKWFKIIKLFQWFFTKSWMTFHSLLFFNKTFVSREESTLFQRNVLKGSETNLSNVFLLVSDLISGNPCLVIAWNEMSTHLWRMTKEMRKQISHLCPFVIDFQQRFLGHCVFETSHNVREDFKKSSLANPVIFFLCHDAPTVVGRI